MSKDGKEAPVSEAANEQSLAELDGLLTELPTEDPPAVLVDRTLAAVLREQTGPDAPEESPDPVRRRHPSSLSWRVVAALLLGAFLLAGVAAIGFGGKITELFQSADVQMETVDTGL